MTQNSFVIRPIEIQDNAGIQSVIQTVMTAFGCVGEGYSIADAEVKEMFQYYQAPGCRYFVVMDGHQVIGGAGIAPLAGSDDGTCELRKMYLLPASRGCGIGEKLLQQCMEFAKTAGYRRCYLETLASMSVARSLYEKWGFNLRSSPLGATGHNKCDIWYERPL